MLYAHESWRYMIPWKKGIRRYALQLHSGQETACLGKPLGYLVGGQVACYRLQRFQGKIEQTGA